MRDLSFPKVLQLLLLAMVSFQIADAAELKPADRPNILFCLADDWGWPHAGSYGDTVVQTPVFDRLAREGALFEYAFVSSPSCTPSRNAILTGQHFYRLGEGANLWGTLSNEHPNFMFLLREAGYQIGHWRKAWGPGTYQAGGYDEHPCGPEMKFTEFIQNRDVAKPFCFWFGTSDPHRPYKAGVGAENGIDPEQVSLPGFYPKDEKIRSDIADYYFEVDRWDSDVGNALKLLEEAGELENTIIVVTGDHGMPFPRCKGNLYDWGARVPLVIHWEKEISVPLQVTQLVSLTDLAPTFLEVAGVEIPDAMTGLSLLGLISGEQVELDSRDYVIFGRERHTPSQTHPSMEGYPARAVRTEEWLLIWNLKPDRWPAGVPDGATHQMNHFSDCDNSPTKEALMQLRDHPERRHYFDWSFAIRPEFELYHCKNDPAQIHNLSGQAEYEQTVSDLKQQLLSNLKQTGDPRVSGGLVSFEQFPYRNHRGKMPTAKK